MASAIEAWRGRTRGPPPEREVEPKLAGLAAANAIAVEHLRSMAAVDSRWRTTFMDAERYAVDQEIAVTAGKAELDALRTHLDGVERDRKVAADALADASIRVDLLQAQYGELDLRRATVEADNIQLLDETRHAEQAAEAARALVAELRQHVDGLFGQLTATQAALADAEARAAAHWRSIEAIHATKTMRWTRPPRELFGRLRRLLRQGPR